MGSHPVPGGYKYRNLALQVGGVSNEIVEYGREFCWTSTQDWLLWQGPEAIVQVNYTPILSSDRAPYSKNPESSERKQKFGHGLQMGARHRGRLQLEVGVGLPAVREVVSPEGEERQLLEAVTKHQTKYRDLED
jgi:hypothetical protein